MKTLFIVLTGASLTFALGMACGVVLAETGFFSHSSLWSTLSTPTFSPLNSTDYTSILAQLNLNPDQKNQIAQILQSVTTQDQSRQLQTVLTPEQLQQWNQLFPESASSSSSPHQQSFIPSKTSQN